MFAMETLGTRQHEPSSVPESSSTEPLHDDQPKSLEARAYQLEMFQESMKSNIIVAMDTGSAKLRIEAELFRTPSKIVWFTAPSVVLAEQQHKFFCRHLPQYNVRLITGQDNTHLWSTQEVWDAVLLHRNIVVSTPQILLEGLTHGFVHLRSISLLVIDEAHHAVAKAPSNVIMQGFFHPFRCTGSAPELPHILGLTASPITTKLASMEILEKNLNSVCISPTLQIEEYRCHVHLPEFVTLSYPSREEHRSLSIETLLGLIQSVDIFEDPWIKQLQKDSKPSSYHRLEKALETRSTYCMEQLKKLQGNIEHLYVQLGSWATNSFLKEVLMKLQSKVESKDWLSSLSDEENRYLNDMLREVRELASQAVDKGGLESQLSSKAQCLIQFLTTEYAEGSSCVIFTERRSTCIALSQLLQDHPSVRYNVAAFVGASNAKKAQNIVDIANQTVLKTELEEFRAGTRSCVVATSVMEEGIDISATSLVIRFDDSKTVRSYIQSRGRARQTASKFVVMRNEGSISGKYLEWTALEAEMKERYKDEMRQLQQRLELEKIEEHLGQVYLVRSTGAKLTFENSRSHLEHFCDSLRKVQYDPNPRPKFICHGILGRNMTATVTLPSSLPNYLHQVSGCRSWRTERAAKRDASFACVKILHERGFINDHLLPPPAPKRDAFTCEARATFVDIEPQVNPWRQIQKDRSNMILHAYHIDLENAPFASSSLIILLPSKLGFNFNVPIYFTRSDVFEANVTYHDIRSTTVKSQSLAEKISLYLLEAALFAHPVNPKNWTGGLPFYIQPNIEEDSLEEWLGVNQTTFPLPETLESPATAPETVIVRTTPHSKPYYSNLQKSEVVIKNPLYALPQRVPAISATKVPRRIDYLTKSNAPSCMSSTPSLLAIQDCTIERISPAIVRTLQLVPSVIRMVEFGLVSADCCKTLLHSFQISNEKLVMEALISPLAYGDINYERMEFFGDTLLKYYAFLQVFTCFSDLPEHYLTIEATKLVNNARLHRAALDIGLDRYMIHDPFIPKRWKPEITFSAPVDARKVMPEPTTNFEEESVQNSRRTSTKVIADHVEALIAVAYLDGDGGDGKAVAFLNDLLPEIKWELPVSNTTACNLIATDLPNFEILSLVEKMIGYQFKQKSLLAEALNHSSVSSDVPTYGRLEFLGDAVLQRLVNESIYKAKTRYSQKDMHLRQSACVSHPYLAFLCFEAQQNVETINVSTILSRQQVELEKTTENKYLWQFMAHSNVEVASAQQRSLKYYLEYRELIREQLSTSKTYPWVLLASISAPKFFSDIVESVLAAVYIDSGADLESCGKFLGKLGLMKLLDRLVEEPDMILAQPKTILWEERSKARLPALKVVSWSRRQPSGQVYGCRLLLEDETYAEVDDSNCEEEAMLRVCEFGLEKFRREGDSELKKVSEAAEQVTKRDSEDESKKRKREDKSESKLIALVSDDDDL